MRKALVGLLAICVGAGLAVNLPPAEARDVTPRAPEFGSLATTRSSQTQTNRAARDGSISGTIVDGIFTTGPAVGCELAPDCAAWRAAGCPGALAGVDPAWHASIVSVRERAGTARAFEVRRGRGESLLLGGVVVQFWTRSCTPLGRPWSSFWSCRLDPACSSQRRYANGLRLGSEWVRTTLVIPSGAAWMTVSANDNLNIRWSLR